MNLTPEDATAEPATPVAPDANATPLLDQREASPWGTNASTPSRSPSNSPRWFLSTSLRELLQSKVAGARLSRPHEGRTPRPSRSTRTRPLFDRAHARRGLRPTHPPGPPPLLLHGSRLRHGVRRRPRHPPRDGAPRRRRRHPREAQAHPHRPDARRPPSKPLTSRHSHGARRRGRIRLSCGRAWQRLSRITRLLQASANRTSLRNDGNCVPRGRKSETASYEAVSGVLAITPSTPHEYEYARGRSCLRYESAPYVPPVTTSSPAAKSGL